MDGKTLHIATSGRHTPFGHFGSNPLAQASRFHLGPDVGIFSLRMVTDSGRLSRDVLFTDDNPLMVSVDVGSLPLVHGAIDSSPMHPRDLRLLIGGVSYLVPYQIAKRIRAKRGGRVFWRTTSGESGTFFLIRSAPPVF